MDSSVFLHASKRKWYLLNVSQMNRFSCPLNMKICGNFLPRTVRDILDEHRLGCLKGLLLYAGRIPIQIVTYVSIYLQTVHGCMDNLLHFSGLEYFW